jgi:transcriptional regulator of arginine metabolism
VNSKQKRQAIILDLVKSNRVNNHEILRELLEKKGVRITQATLSRDMRELRLVKVQGSQGIAHYRFPEAWENKAILGDLLPTLFISAEGTDNLVVIHTLMSGAAALATAIDWEGWPEVIGTVAGEDTIIVVVRSRECMSIICDRLGKIARGIQV